MALGKYPLMIVKGPAVTFDQADEILIRTNNWTLDSQNGEWSDTVYQACGIPMGTLNLPHPRDIEDFAKKHGGLGLEHCHNERIMTRNPLGPRGWCNWDGEIKFELPITNGSWPEFADLVADWTVIAATFPFLECCVQFTDQELDSKVLSSGHFETGVKPTHQITVKFGKVKADISERGFTRMKHKYNSRDDVRVMSRRATSFLGQQGVPLDRLKEALDRVSPL